MNGGWARWGWVIAAVGVVAFAVASARPMPATTVPAWQGTSGERGPQVVVLAGGCFWGLEAVFEHTRGVLDVRSGYAGGSPEDADYARVSSGQTGHAEAVRIAYDPQQVRMDQLLNVFFSVAHDPTQVGGQGPDRGPQYRSAVFTTTPEQARVVGDYVGQLRTSKTFERPMTTTVAPLVRFFDAEDHHQDYARLHPNAPYIVVHDAPKVEALRQRFPDLYRDGP